PVGEAVAGIAGTRDDAGTDHGDASRNQFMRRLFAEDLELPVVLQLHVLGRSLRNRKQWTVFKNGFAPHLVDRNRRDKKVLSDAIAQPLGRAAYGTGISGPGINDSIPFAIGQPIEIGVAIADDPFDSLK